MSLNPSWEAGLALQVLKCVTLAVYGEAMTTGLCSVESKLRMLLPFSQPQCLQDPATLTVGAH